MNHTNNGKSGLHEGPNTFAVPPRVLALGFYDGPTDGVIQFGSGSVFEFKLADEDSPADSRVFTFSPLPPDALDRISAAIAPHIEPVWPVWTPIWRFPTREDQHAVDATIDTILAEADFPEWQVTTADYATFRTFRAERLPVSRPG